MSMQKEERPMVEKEVRSASEVLGVIQEVIAKKNIKIANLEKMSKISLGSISKWENSVPSVERILKVLHSLDLEMIIRTEKSEDMYSDEENRKCEDNIDLLIIELIVKILRESSITVSDKEKLYKILQAFL